MAKVSWFRALAMAGLLADELTTASADGKIDTAEALVIVKDLAKASGLIVDSDGMDFTEEILTDLLNAAADGKITIKEIIDFAEKICLKLGIEFDKTGVQIG